VKNAILKEYKKFDNEIKTLKLSMDTENFVGRPTKKRGETYEERNAGAESRTANKGMA